MRIPIPGRMRRLAYAQKRKASVKLKGGGRMMASRALAIWYDDMGAERHVGVEKGSVVQGPD